MNSKDLNNHMQRAVALHQQGDYVRAASMYREALRYFPKNADILNLLGTLKSQQGKYHEGIKLLTRALRLRPGHPYFLVNLGEAQKRVGKIENAEKSFKRALLKAPDLPVAHYNLANILKDKGEAQQGVQYYEKALVHYERALEKQPRAEYYYNYGNTLRYLGRLKSAKDAYLKSVQLNPNHHDAHNNLGVVLLDWDEYENAHHHFQEAVRLKPGNSSAHNNLFQFYGACGQVDKALEQLHQIKMDPEDEHVLPLIAATTFPIITRSNEEIDYYINHLDRTVRQLDAPISLKTISHYQLTPPSVMTYYGRDDRGVREAFYNLYSTSFQPLELKISNARPHLGFVVTRGHEGVFLKCMAGLLRKLPAQFDTTIVCSRPNGRTIIEQELPGFRYLELPPELEDAVKMLADAKFDLLHYWEIGTDVVNYILPFFKPARIQMASWGWPVTSGIHTVDYYLSCKHLESPGSDAHYTEQLLQTQRLPINYYRPPAPDVAADRADFGLQDQQHFYLCTQNLRKIHPDMDPLLEGILAQDDRAIIGLISDKRPAVTELLRKRLSQRLDMSRVRIFERMDADVYLGLVKTADLILDSLHYTGGANTNYDALAAGVPMLTLPTAFHRGRFTKAVYDQIGAGQDCIASSPEDFIQKALRLAQDRVHRQRVIDELNEASHSLFEDQAAVDELVEVIEGLL